MRKIDKKLSRDRVPEIIQASGREFAVEAMDEAEFDRALREKLVEEAQETAAADSTELVAELADLYEVMEALMAVYRIDREAVVVEQKRRHRNTNTTGIEGLSEVEKVTLKTLRAVED